MMAEMTATVENGRLKTDAALPVTFRSRLPAMAIDYALCGTLLERDPANLRAGFPHCPHLTWCRFAVCPRGSERRPDTPSHVLERKSRIEGASLWAMRA